MLHLSRNRAPKEIPKGYEAGQMQKQKNPKTYPVLFKEINNKTGKYNYSYGMSLCLTLFTSQIFRLLVSCFKTAKIFHYF